MKMKLFGASAFGACLLLNACSSHELTSPEEELLSSSSTWVVQGSSGEIDESSSSGTLTASSSSVVVGLSSSSDIAALSSSSGTPLSSSSIWIDYPYYSSGIFCFTEGCEENFLSSSSQVTPSSSSVVVIPSSSSKQDPIVDGNTLTDSRDGQQYDIITVGDKRWLLQDLNYETVGSVCYDDVETNCDVYGRLYDYEAAQQACPSGWHMATRSEYEAAMADPSFVWVYGGRKKNENYDFLKGMGFNWVLGSPIPLDKESCTGDCGVILVQKNPNSEYAGDPALFFQTEAKDKGFSVRCVQN